MGNLRSQLAVRTILVTFVAAIDTISRLPAERDIRVLLAEGARDRALHFLEQAEAHLAYDEGSRLDDAIREARRRIEEMQVPPD